jgi:hypothetical protein
MMPVVETSAASETVPTSPLLRWTRKHLGPWPKAREFQVACGAVLLISVVLTGLSVVMGFRDVPFLGHEPGGDFLAFYVSGKILNEHPHTQLYDLRLQRQLQHELRPRWDQDTMLVVANAPYVAVLFQPLARLPYLWAYVAWLGISATLYVGGFVLIWPRGEPFDKLWPTARLIALSFFPFAFECWFGGQLSVIGFFALALGIRCQRLEQPVLSGAALAVCAYKPTLLLLLIPMLAIGRRFRTLAGFVGSVCVLAGISFVTVGASGLEAYVQTLRLYGRVVASGGSTQQLFKYIDVNTFVRILFGGPSVAGTVVAVAVGGAIFVCLAYAWNSSDRYNQGSENLLWAATIAWTLVANVYVPIYDGTMVVLSGLLMAAALYGTKRTPLRVSELRRFHVALVGLYVVAIVSQYLAPAIRVQLMTLGVAGFGALAFQFWRTESRRSGS